MGAQFRFVHCADLHLGARFRGLSKTDAGEAERMTGSVFESFSRIVDTAIREHADAMFISGDSFDEETITPRTRMFLAEELGRVGIPVFMVRGNHDPVTSWESSIPFPSNVHVFGTQPERVDIPGVDGAEAVGASFSDWHDERNIPSMLTGSPGKFTVACVHCDVDNPGADYSYSPCSMSDFRGKGIDYWALGHIHKRTVLMTDPWVVYPGNIQGRSFKETGEKGAYLVTVRDGTVADARFFATQGIVWNDVEEDITDKDVESLISDLRMKLGPGSVSRITLTGSGDLDLMARSGREDLMGMISRRTGSRICDIDVMSSPCVDLDARVQGKDMVAKVICSGRALRDSGRDEILAAIADNPMARAHMETFRELTDAELEGLVDSAVKILVSKMEAAR